MNNRFYYNNKIINNNEYPSNYIVFDVETTGLDPKEGCQIIEYTFLKYENNILVDELSSLVKPKKEIPYNVINLTGIDNSMVKDCKCIDEHLENIINFIDGYTIIGHNVRFDFGFLKYAIINSNKDLKTIKVEYIDTLDLARTTIFNIVNYKLETLKNYFKIESISHRSKADCLVTNEVYINCINLLKTKVEV